MGTITFAEFADIVYICVLSSFLLFQIFDLVATDGIPNQGNKT